MTPVVPPKQQQQQLHLHLQQAVQEERVIRQPRDDDDDAKPRTVTPVSTQLAQRQNRREQLTQDDQDAQAREEFDRKWKATRKEVQRIILQARAQPNKGELQPQPPKEPLVLAQSTKNSVVAAVRSEDNNMGTPVVAKVVVEDNTWEDESSASTTAAYQSLSERIEALQRLQETMLRQQPLKVVQAQNVVLEEEVEDEDVVATSKNTTRALSGMVVCAGVGVAVGVIVGMQWGRGR